MFFSLIWERLVLMEQTGAVNLKRNQHVKIEAFIAFLSLQFLWVNIFFEENVCMLMVNCAQSRVNETMISLLG